MKNYRFTIVIRKEPDDPGYYASSPELPGCFSSGRTVDETRRNMREAVELHVESLLAHGDPIPQPGADLFIEEMTLGIPA